MSKNTSTSNDSMMQMVYDDDKPEAALPHPPTPSQQPRPRRESQNRRASFLVRDVEEDMLYEIEQEEANKMPGCGIMGRYPVTSIFLAAILGAAVGVGLSYWEPEDPNDKATAVRWIGLFGDLFIRALKCVVLPLVFVNVIISVVEMMAVGKCGAVGLRTLGMYVVTTLIAAIIGIVFGMAFLGLFQEGEFETPGPAMVALGCTQPGYLMAELDDGNVACSANYTTDMPEAQFIIQDLSGRFVSTSSNGPRDDISMSDTIYEGVFTKLVTDNIINSFAATDFAAVVMFAILFGIGLAQAMERMRRAGATHEYMLGFLKEIDTVLIIIINWLIACTPFAVFSLIAQALGSQNDLGPSFANVGYLVLCTVFAMAAHILITYIGLFALITRTNPFGYLKYIIPAQTTAFATQSSAVTLGMTIKCVKATHLVPDAIARFVLPLGATVNMDGAAIYFPIACIWLAILNGITPTVGQLILLAIISSIGSAGAAPVPSSGLVLIITAYNTVFDTTGVPNGFSFVIAIDWFVDRLITMMNITGDTVVARIVSHWTPLEEAEQFAHAAQEEYPSAQKVSAGHKDDEVEEDGKDPKYMSSGDSEYMNV